MEREGNRAGRWATGIALVFALAVGAIGGSVFTSRSGGKLFGSSSTVPVRVSSSSPVDVGEISFSSGFAAVVQSVLPSVVNIASSKIVTTRQSPFMDDPLFRRFFGDQFPLPRERRERSLGSGVIISPEGYILTNNHVVGGATEITISTSDNKDYDARIVGTDSMTDIAVVKVEGQRLPVAVLGDSSKVRVGEFALAVGSPFGLSQTVTMGIISATGRVNLGIEDYEDFIQTDTAINPGNSGGALVNVRGELIGINTAIVSGGSGNQGVGFAIPINMAREVMGQILKHGRVIRGYLGAWIQPVTPEIARLFNLSKATGALLGHVEPGTPAAKGGLQRGDIILEMNGEPVTDWQALRMKIAMTPPGSKVRFKVLQNGSQRTVDVTLGELPVREEEPKAQGKAEPSGPLSGLYVENLSPGIGRQLGLPPGTQGVVVMEVQQGSAAGEAGLQRGDVIMEINRKAVANVSDFERLAATAKGSVLLLINRQGQTRYVVVNR